MGVLDCRSNEDLCGALSVEAGVYFFEAAHLKGSKPVVSTQMTGLGNGSSKRNEYKVNVLRFLLKSTKISLTHSMV